MIDWGPLFKLAPYQKHSETSKAAAKVIELSGKRLTKRQQVFDCLMAFGPQTDEEIQRNLKMPESSQRPRRVELVERGMVRDSGMKRRTLSGLEAVVWEAIAHG